MAEEKKMEPGKENKPHNAGKEDSRLIVRIVGIDLDGKKPIQRSLTKIKGLGTRMAKNIAVIFEKETGVSPLEKTGKLTDEQTKKLEQIILNPVKAGVPAWSVNRKKDYETGEDLHFTMSELDLGLRGDKQRLIQVKSYRGLRSAWGLPVRGQKTRSTHRGKGSIVGVTKKDSGQAKAAPKPAASAAPKPAAGKKK